MLQREWYTINYCKCSVNKTIDNDDLANVAWPPDFMLVLITGQVSRTEKLEDPGDVEDPEESEYL